VANRAAADQLVANVLPIVRTIRASPASLASLRRSMLVTFEPRRRRLAYLDSAQPALSGAGLIFWAAASRVVGSENSFRA